MHILEIILLILGALAGLFGLITILGARRYQKPVSFRRFDDL